MEKGSTFAEAYTGGVAKTTPQRRQPAILFQTRDNAHVVEDDGPAAATLVALATSSGLREEQIPRLARGIISRRCPSCGCGRSRRNTCLVGGNDDRTRAANARDALRPGLAPRPEGTYMSRTPMDFTCRHVDAAVVTFILCPVPFRACGNLSHTLAARPKTISRRGNTSTLSQYHHHQHQNQRPTGSRDGRQPGHRRSHHGRPREGWGAGVRHGRQP